MLMNSIDSEIEYLKNYDGSAIKLMEVCGTHTAEIFRSGIRSFLSPKIQLISGPGCPVCVTQASFIDSCIEISMRKNHVLLSFGDMLKVPGRKNNAKSIIPSYDSGDNIVGMSLSEANGFGGSIRMIYSPFEAVQLAEENPSITYVIAAVGFETTTPAYALLLDEIIEKGLTNIKFITALKLTLPAIEWICVNEKSIDGFLCPGHVSVITGSDAYKSMAEKYSKSFVVAGFEANHLVNAISTLVNMIEKKTPSGICNLYEETVTEKGNIKAQEITAKYYEACDTIWRGIGTIQGSGLKLREQYSCYEIESLITEDGTEEAFPKGCRCSEVITGRITPAECPFFGKECKPSNPHGPCMVSTEGACGIWYRNI